MTLPFGWCDMFCCWTRVHDAAHRLCIALLIRVNTVSEKLAQVHQDNMGHNKLPNFSHIYLLCFVFFLGG